LRIASSKNAGTDDSLSEIWQIKQRDEVILISPTAHREAETAKAHRG